MSSALNAASRASATAALPSRTPSAWPRRTVTQQPSTWSRKPAATPAPQGVVTTPAPGLNPPTAIKPTPTSIKKAEPTVTKPESPDTASDSSESAPEGDNRIFRMAEKKVASTRRQGFNVTTSLVALNFQNKNPFSIYKYDVKMTVKVEGVEKKMMLNKEETVSVFRNFAENEDAKKLLKNVYWSDFKSLFFSRYSIPATTFTVPLDERRTVDIVITPTETITVADIQRDCDERFIQAFSNAVSYETLMEKGVTTISSKIYSGKTFVVDRNFLEGRMGVNYNFRTTEKGLMIAVDQCATAFITAGPLLNTVRSICNKNFDERTGIVGKRSLSDLNKYLLHVKVISKHLGYSHQYTIKKFTSLNANTCRFKLEVEGKETEMTISEYFKKQYKIILKYPLAPLVETTRKNFIPMELLSIKPNQRFGNMLSPYQTSQMILSAAAPPADCRRTIEDYVQSDKVHLRLLKSFDIEVGSSLEKVTGYQVPLPSMKCGPAQNLSPVNGAWRNNDKFEVHKKINNCITVFLDTRNDCDRATRTFFKELSKIMQIPNPDRMPIIQPPLQRVETELYNLIEGGKKKGIKYDLIFFFIGGNDPQEYKEVKRISDTVFNIPSQCIVVNKMQKMIFKGYASNIAQKINAKLGGKNCVCMKNPTTAKNVMVCGADVTHPMPGEKCVSVASVVGSFDKDFTQYAGEARVQGRGKETITDMVTMMETMFNTYYRKNNTVPESVVFYRDGVGDQMFNLILKEEIPKIFIAFHKCFPTYPHDLKLTFIVCQKRHTVKFFPDAKNADKNGNAKPGLVVDQGIVSKNNTEFYLQSQATIKGTGRACRYTTLYDDNNWKLEDMEYFTFALCHLFNRCTRSIGICSPARYAHHLCFRARDILRVSEGDDSTTTSSNSKMSVGTVNECFDFDYSMKDKMFYI